MMRIKQKVGWIGAVVAVLATAAADRKQARPVTVAAGVSPEPVNMKTVNGRWKGIRCQIRFAPEITKGTDRTGWSRSKWMTAPALPGERQLYIRFWVSDRAALDRGGFLRRGKFIRPGTPFIATAWSFREPARQKHIILELRFQQAPVQARLEFRGTKAIDLEDVERIARVELFQLLAAPSPPLAPAAPPAKDRAAEAAPFAPPPDPPAGARESAAATPTGITVYRPAVEILAVSVKPAQASRGSQVTLIVHYAVKGLPPGAGFEITERRILKLNGKTLATFEETLPRSLGSYTSAQRIDVPDNAAPGVYTFEAEVSLAGLTARDSALFEIR